MLKLAGLRPRAEARHADLELPLRQRGELAGRRAHRDLDALVEQDVPQLAAARGRQAPRIPRQVARAPHDQLGGGDRKHHPGQD